MKWLSLDSIEKSVVPDKNFLYTIVSYFVVLAIFLNLNSFQSSLFGLIASGIFLMINAVFLGNAFFAKENALLRLTFGTLLLIMLLGFVGWVTLIIYNLDTLRVALVLLVVATFSSLMNKRTRHRNAA